MPSYFQNKLFDIDREILEVGKTCLKLTVNFNSQHQMPILSPGPGSAEIQQ
jgi:hypothetical protein